MHHAKRSGRGGAKLCHRSPFVGCCISDCSGTDLSDYFGTAEAGFLTLFWFCQSVSAGSRGGVNRTRPGRSPWVC